MNNQKLKKQTWKKGYTYVHVNQGEIKTSNKLRKAALDGEITQECALAQMPFALTAKTNNSNDYGSMVIITHPDTGEELGRFEHTPFNPYTCGAQIVFKTKMKVEVIK